MPKIALLHPTASRPIPAQATVASANISDTSEAYEKLVALKTEDYKQQSVADFNQSLAPNNGDISGLLDAQADVLASISPDDKITSSSR